MSVSELAFLYLKILNDSLSKCYNEDEGTLEDVPPAHLLREVRAFLKDNDIQFLGSGEAPSDLDKLADTYERSSGVSNVRNV